MSRAPGRVGYATNLARGAAGYLARQAGLIATVAEPNCVVLRVVMMVGRLACRRRL